MKPLIVDTSLWIQWSKHKNLDLRESARSRILYLPSIVAMELLSGAKSRESYRAIQDLIGSFQRNHRLLLPLWQDYQLAGDTLADLGWPASKKSNDVLIAALARRIGAEIWTLDQSDFQILSRALHVPISEGT